MTRLADFLEGAGIPLLMLAIAAIFARGGPWILGVIANG